MHREICTPTQRNEHTIKKGNHAILMTLSLQDVVRCPVCDLLLVQLTDVPWLSRDGYSSWVLFPASLTAPTSEEWLVQPDGVHVATSVDTPSFVIVQVMVSLSVKSVQLMVFVMSSSTSMKPSRHLWIFTSPASQHVCRSVWNFCSQR